MADNTQQSGADTLRTVDRSSIKTGVSLLDIAQASAAELLGLGFPKTVVATSAGLTVATTAYTAGDVLGTELTFSGVARASGRGLIITSAVLVDAAKVLGAVDLFLFDRASTPAADNAANSWADADRAGGRFLGRVGFETPVVSALNSDASGIVGLPIVVIGNASVDIKGVLVTRIGHTFFGAVGDIAVTLGVEQF